MTSLKPKVFIGSSSDHGLDMAYAVQDNLSRYAHVDVWDQDLFAPTKAILETLLIPSRGGRRRIHPARRLAEPGNAFTMKP